MKNTILCGLAVLVAGGGVAFVVANRPEAPAPTAASPAEPRLADPPPPAGPCPKCAAGGTVYDVTDLSARFAARSESSGEFVSFDEPPLAKPKGGELTPVRHDAPPPDEPREVLPPPREVK